MAFTSCRSPEVFAQEIKPVKPAIELTEASPLGLICHSYEMKLSQKEIDIKAQKDTEHLLRTEIDALKKKLIQLELDYKIDKVNKDLNKITKE